VVEGLRLVTGGQRSDPLEFEVGYVDPDDREVRRLFADALTVAFEWVPPVRSFPSYKRQRNHPGLYWSACCAGHVGVESWLECDEAMPLEFDAAVTCFAPQPFWLFWPAGGRSRSHAPDFFARRVDGTAVVIDCRPAQRIEPLRWPPRRSATGTATRAAPDSAHLFSEGTVSARHLSWESRGARGRRGHRQARVVANSS
jgi:hypothetical protein